MAQLFCLKVRIFFELTSSNSILFNGFLKKKTGNTVVMASVYGPLEAKIQKELSDRMYIDLNFKPKTGMPGTNAPWMAPIFLILPIFFLLSRSCWKRERKIDQNNLQPDYPDPLTSSDSHQHHNSRNAGRRSSNCFRRKSYKKVALIKKEKLSWSLFQILAAAINASCLALMDSGISMQCLVAAVTCLVGEEEEITMDPSLQQVKVNVQKFYPEGNYSISFCSIGRIQSHAHICIWQSKKRADS